MHPELESIFQQLNDEVTYAVLRGLDERSGVDLPSDDIDVLVEERHVAKVSRVFARRGYSLIYSLAHRPHIFFVKCMPETNDWLKFDVVTELSFGRTAKCLTVEHDEMLRGRVLDDSVYRLSQADELLLLVLHCLLDKRAIRSGHRARLHELAVAIGAQSSAVVAHPPFSADFIGAMVAMAQQQQWEQLLALRNRLRNSIVAARPLRSFFTFVVREVQARLLAPVQNAICRRGVMVALLAPDGGGKTTLASAMRKDTYIRARVHYLGLHGRAMTSLDRGDPKSLLGRAVRWLAVATQLWSKLVTAILQRAMGKTIIFDRYMYDSMLSSEPRTWAKRLRRRILTSGWPKPDIVILLDAPGEVLFSRKREHTPEYLESQRQGYLQSCRDIPNVVRVDATLPAEAVARKVRSVIWERVSSR